MAVSHCIENYLSVAHVDYQLIHHGFTESAFDSACSAHVPTASLVKAVMLRDRRAPRFAMALIPASHKLKLAWLQHQFSGDMVLAQEAEFAGMFPDCVLGAIPGFGQAYRLDMVWDEDLLRRPELFFEAGDHEFLIKIEQREFRDLFGRYPSGVISLPHDSYAVYHADELRGGLH